MYFLARVLVLFLISIEFAQRVTSSTETLNSQPVTTSQTDNGSIVVPEINSKKTNADIIWDLWESSVELQIERRQKFAAAKQYEEFDRKEFRKKVFEAKKSGAGAPGGPEEDPLMAELRNRTAKN